MMKTKCKLLAIVIATIIMTAVSSCKKYDGSKETDPKSPVKLMGTVRDGSKGVVGELTSGSTITGDQKYVFCFWLMPADTTHPAKGTYTIKNAFGVIIYTSAIAENGIDFNFPAAGTYRLDVVGTFNNKPFSYNNISVVVTDGTVPPVNSNTSPVKLKGMTTSATATNLILAISRAEYSTISGATWFYVSGINGNFNHSAATLVGDSIFFTISFATVSGTTPIEFNGGYENGSSGGVWFTAGAPYSNPSILYQGPDNYWKINVTNNGTTVVAKAPNGTILLTIPAYGAVVIPGNNGDDEAHGSTIRWSGYSHFLKYTGSNFYCEYKIGNNGTWTPITGTIYPENTMYWKIIFPSSLYGEVHFRYGSMVGGVFTPATSTMQQSMYYNITLGELIKNM